MRLKRAITGLISAALLGVTPLAFAPPANAVAATTTTTLKAYDTTAVYKDELRFTAQVVGVDPATGGAVGVYDGTVSLQRSTPTSPAWSTIASSTSPSYAYFSGIKAFSNAQFRVVYSGGASGADTYSPSTSATTAVKVQRKVTIKLLSSKLTIKGKVKPDYKKKKVLVDQKIKGKWKRYKTLRTDKRGKFKVRFFAKRGKKLFFRLTVKGDKKFTKFRQVYYTIRYRDASDRALIG